MSKKKKKANAGPPKALIRLSQCMIVKNEEKNIERALGWGKGIAFEQIVVDTGSTDKTAEIAERLGAKVFHFEWINDFSAAKNFAIEQAQGNWIAFLDADEYFSPNDARKIIPLLKYIQKDPGIYEKSLALNCTIVNLNDDGTPKGMTDQERIFRNIPRIRFRGKIHERLTLEKENVTFADDLAILHTGYSQTAYEETGKTDRNVDMLRANLKENPDDINLKAYLADSLVGKSDGESMKEAESLFQEIVDTKADVYPPLKRKAYVFFIRKRLAENSLSEAEDMCRGALRAIPGDIDLEYYLGTALNMKKDFAGAFSVLTGSEKKFLGASQLDIAYEISAKPAMLFTQLAVAAQGLDDIPNTIKYATMTLALDKSQTGVLSPYIATLLKNGTTEDEVTGLLSQIYDMNDTRDLVSIAKAARDCGAIGYAREILSKRDAILEALDGKT